jgi:4-amino-4-deoxy-L-arabinose transferase-like glycosyltransferase
MTYVNSLKSRRISTHQFYGFCVILALGITVRVWFLNRPMQYDEATTYNEYASRTLWMGMSEYTSPNNHLLNTFFVHISTILIGNEPWAIRLPAFVAGVLLIPASYAMVAVLCGRSAAIIAAALVASSEPLINYSTNARGYAFVCLATTLVVILAQRIRVSGGRATEWGALNSLSALGFFAMPTMLYPYGGILLWLLVTSRRVRHRRKARVRLDRIVGSVAITAILAALLYLPVLTMGTSIISIIANRFVLPQSPHHVLRALPGSLGSAWLQWNLDVPRSAAVAAVVAWVVTLAWPVNQRNRRGDLSALLCLVIGWSLAVALAQRVVPFDRVWLFALPLYAGCVAAALSGLIKRLNRRGEWSERLYPGVAVLICLVLCSFVVRGDSMLRETRELSLFHADAIARLLKPRLKPGDCVLAVMPCDATLKYAFLHRGVPVTYLGDYRFPMARRLFVVVERPSHQSVPMVLSSYKIPPALSAQARVAVVCDFGDSVLYELDHR